MTDMYKTFLLGALAILVLGTLIVLVLHAVDASGEVGGVVFMLGAAAAGLIGSEVARRMPPPRQPR
jgi:uncharacterized membrane protein YfcA